MPEATRAGGSYRDPSGHVFRSGDRVYRTVSASYAEEYDLLLSSGLYEKLTARRWMVAHEEVDVPGLSGDGVHRVLAPEVIGYVSYPYEWSFSQLKDAALLTLKIASLALDHGMSLKDASAYNVQFRGARPVFIDTLSFERYVPGEPWIAYRQFCRQFLAPLALMALVDVRTQWLLRDDLDGIPLDLASTMLPGRTRLKPALAMHIHAHARAEARYADSGRGAAEGDGAGGAAGAKARSLRVSETGVRALIDSLRRAVEALDWKPAGTEWCDYYADTNYSGDAMTAKEATVAAFIEQISPKTAWDLGANTARFSRLAAERGAYTCAFDIDPAAVEKAYRDARTRKDDSLLPLRMDLMNPSPGLGWRLAERESFAERGRPDVVLALALVHHLAIGRNVPLPDLAEFFAGLTEHLIVEFVPKADSQVVRLLASREDIFPDYTEDGFEAAFSHRFEILRREEVSGSERTMYLMRRTDTAERS